MAKGQIMAKKRQLYSIQIHLSFVADWRHVCCAWLHPGQFMITFFNESLFWLITDQNWGKATQTTHQTMKMKDARILYFLWRNTLGGGGVGGWGKLDTSLRHTSSIYISVSHSSFSLLGVCASFGISLLEQHWRLLAELASGAESHETVILAVLGNVQIALSRK